MPESTFRDMTADDLWPSDGDDDLAYFQAACLRLVERFGLTDQAATDAVLGNGDWYRHAYEILAEGWTP